MNKQAKALNILCLIISIMGVLMLFLPVLDYFWESYYGKLYHYTDTGFSLLSFSSKGIGDDYVGILGALSWVQLIAGLIMTVLSLISLAKGESKLTHYYRTFIVIEISAFLYLVEGIAAQSVSTAMGSYASTYTWIAFSIITTLSVLIIIFIDGFKKANPEMATNTNVNYQDTQAMPQEDGALFTIDGEVKLLKVYDNYVTMETKVNARALLTNNLFGGTKKVFYQNMLSVQFKESTTFILGYIQFETANTSSSNNFNSENSVTFDYRKVPNEYAKQVVDFVENKIMAKNAPNVITQASSSADELLKFKNLLDLGVITQEEFDAKKKELLSK